MRLLIDGDLLEVGVECAVESGRGELLLGVVGEALTVEGILEMLQGQGIVELMGRLGWTTCSVEEAHTMSASVMAVALLARGAAVLKPAAATRATMDWEYFIVGIL